MTMIFSYSDQDPTDTNSGHCDYHEITVVIAPIWRTLIFLEMRNGKKVLSTLFAYFQDSAKLAGPQMVSSKSDFQPINSLVNVWGSQSIRCCIWHNR